MHRFAPRYPGVFARVLVPLVLCVSAVSARAQDVVVGAQPGTDITVAVDSTRLQNRDRSLGLALLGSALLPGAGEAYLRQKNSAEAFLLTEIGFWSALFVAWQARDSYLQSARNYAEEYAGANAAGQGETYLNLLATYRSYAEAAHRQDSYELSQVLSGVTSGNYAVPPSEAWDFGSSNTPANTAHWHEFQSILNHYRGAKIALSFAVGGLILNRVVSLAHTLRLYRRTSGKGLSFRIDPEIGPEMGGFLVSTSF